jgi:hypothetical protein
MQPQAISRDQKTLFHFAESLREDDDENQSHNKVGTKRAYHQAFPQDLEEIKITFDISVTVSDHSNDPTPQRKPSDMSRLLKPTEIIPVQET